MVSRSRKTAKNSALKAEKKPEHKPRKKDKPDPRDAPPRVPKPGPGYSRRAEARIRREPREGPDIRLSGVSGRIVGKIKSAGTTAPGPRRGRHPDTDEDTHELFRKTRQVLRRPAPLSFRERRQREQEKRERRLEERRERRQRYKADIEGADDLQRLVRQMHAAQFGAKVTRANPWQPPGLLDQHQAASARVWRLLQARRLRKAQRVALGLRRGDYHTYAVTLAKPEWILPHPDPAILPKIRKEVQRQSKRIPVPSVVTGIIDLCPLRDVLSGTEGWAFHVHLTIQLAVASFAEGKKAIRAAYPYKSQSARGVPRGRVVKNVFDTRGWDFYQDKLFQYGGIKLRIVRIDDWSGKRRRAVKRRMLVSQQAEAAMFFSKIRPDDLMIWVGHRRYGDRILPMPCNRSKSRKGASQARNRDAGPPIGR